MGNWVGVSMDNLLFTGSVPALYLFNPLPTNDAYMRHELP